MTCVERVVEYGQLPPEAPLESTKGSIHSPYDRKTWFYPLILLLSLMIFLCCVEKKQEENWPRDGNIEFDKISLRYKDTDQPVLNDISCTIRSKQKVESMIDD